MLEALVKAVDIARECRLNAPTYWLDVIKAVNNLLPKEGMEKFKEFCMRMEYGLGEYDANHIDDLKIGFNTDDEDEADS